MPLVGCDVGMGREMHRYGKGRLQQHEKEQAVRHLARNPPTKRIPDQKDNRQDQRSVDQAPRHGIGPEDAQGIEGLDGSHDSALLRSLVVKQSTEVGQFVGREPTVLHKVRQHNAGGPFQDRLE